MYERRHFLEGSPQSIEDVSSKGRVEQLIK